MVQGVSYAKDGTLASCLFCNFANKSERKDLLHEDDLCVAFLPLDVSAVQHFMMVPKEHVATVSARLALPQSTYSLVPRT